MTLGFFEAALGRLGRVGIKFFKRRIEQASFAGRLYIEGLIGFKGSRPRRRLIRKLTLYQILIVFKSSVLLLSIFGLLLGFLWAVIWYGTLANLGGATTLNGLLISVHLQEISPILTTMVVIIAYCGPMSLELVWLKSSGEFSSLRLMGASPEHVLGWPRTLALIWAFPGLILIFNLFALAGAYWGTVSAIDLPLAEFGSDLLLAVKPFKFFMLAVKIFIISVSVGFFCLYNCWTIPEGGYNLAPGAVRRAMCEAFVYSTLAGVLVTILYG
ncbi:MAG: ABC transporter permease [Deltaproteobacteria bacterium]|jgi:ABC-type transporter Mla maintaining outer membrane lipid asymmetry permease subunit MlaE|nr:ABC transporter permease [Deltaproteobacteria bacterium]